MAMSVSDLRSKGVALRSIGFNALLILVMKLSFLTYFVLTPCLHHMAADLSVSTQTTTLVAAIYEAGKFVGCIVYGRLGDSGNVLQLLLGSLMGFAAVSCLLFALLQSGLRTHTPIDFVVFTMIYFPLSIICIAPQFGLMILKQTNSPERFKFCVLMQGLLACMLQALSVPFGDAVSRSFGWRAEFVALGCFSGCTGLLLYLAASSAHVEACQPKSAGTALPLLSEDKPVQESYGGKVAALLFGSEHRSFQVFLATLGTATATMYLIPMYGMALIHGDPAKGLVSEADASFIVAMTFLGNLLARLTAIVASQVSELTFVNIGMACLLVGSLMLRAGLALALTSVPAVFGIACFGIQIGVGFVMPNCKAGALLGVKDTHVSAANSLIKLAQLIVTATAQLLATASNCAASMDRFANLLLAWNAISALALFGWWCWRA